MLTQFVYFRILFLLVLGNHIFLSVPSVPLGTFVFPFVIDISINFPVICTFFFLISLFGIPIFYLISIIQQNREYVLDFYTKFGVVLSVLLRCVFLLRMILRLCILSSYLQKIILKSFFFFLVYDSLIFNSNEFVGHYKSVSVSISSFRLFQFHLRTFFLSLIFIITTFPIHCLSYHSFLFQIIVHKTLPIFILQ